MGGVLDCSRLRSSACVQDDALLLLDLLGGERAGAGASGSGSGSGSGTGVVGGLRRGRSHAVVEVEELR